MNLRAVDAVFIPGLDRAPAPRIVELAPVYIVGVVVFALVEGQLVDVVIALLKPIKPCKIKVGFLFCKVRYYAKVCE